MPRRIKDRPACLRTVEGLEREYRRIVSAFNGIVRLHVASLSMVLGAVGSSCASDPFETFEEAPAGTRAVDDAPNPPKRSVMNLIGSARSLSQAAVEGGPVTGASLS